MIKLENEVDITLVINEGFSIDILDLLTCSITGTFDFYELDEWAKENGYTKETLK